MEADAFAGLQAANKFGLIGVALALIGLCLNAALGVINRDEWTRMRGVIAALAAGVVGAAMLRLLLSVAQLNGGWSGAFAPDLLALVWSVQANAILTLGAGVLIVIVGLLSSHPLIGGVGACAIAASFGMTGHTHALDPPGFAPLVVALHVALAGFWIAAPITLWPRRALSDAALSERLARFSAAALWAAPLVIVGGFWLALRLTGGWDALVESTYGRLLLGKVGAVSLALGLGALNKLKVSRAIAHGNPRGRLWLMWTLGADAALFAATAGLIAMATTLTGPP